MKPKPKGRRGDCTLCQHTDVRGHLGLSRSALEEYSGAAFHA